MLNECLRLASNWLQDGTNGLNAHLANVPREAGDPLPASITLFATEHQNEDAALVRLPTTTPAVVLTVESATAVRDATAHDVGDGSVTVAIRVSTSDVDALDAKRNGSYYLRALLWSLRRWITQDVNGAARKRNSLAITEIQSVEINSLFERVNDVTVIAGARVTLVVRDVGL